MLQKPEPKTAYTSSANPAFVDRGRIEGDAAPITWVCSQRAGQSRKASGIEAITNVLVGFGLAAGANYILINWYGYPISLWESSTMATIFTALSLVRSYALRRLFNHFQ